MIKTKYFNRPFLYACGVDIGLKRHTNEDVTVSCPEYGFFAVSDGMGGLGGGAETAEMIAKSLPTFIGKAYKELSDNPSPALAEKLLKTQIGLISDNIYENLNAKKSQAVYGATLSCVWFIGNHAVFLNLGDSRGYLLDYYKRRILQVTADHNVAALLVAGGEITEEEARNHPSSAALTRFVGMESPAPSDTFIHKVRPGDRILLCSDGLHGMVEDNRLPTILRSSRSQKHVVKRLIGEANRAGGRDNISAVYIKII
jgi:serine/threonine protein phosphatase PrpC